jgi:hypothetical protein
VAGTACNATGGEGARNAARVSTVTAKRIYVLPLIPPCPVTRRQMRSAKCFLTPSVV